MLLNFIVVDASLTGGEIRPLDPPDVISISDTVEDARSRIWFLATSGDPVLAVAARRSG